MYKVTVFPGEQVFSAQPGENLYRLLLREGLSPAAPCGGTGKCGKCMVQVNGVFRAACKTEIAGDITVVLPDAENMRILTESASVTASHCPLVPGYAAVFDIGTTTLCCYLLDAHEGREIASRAMPNPQRAAGADVVSRIRLACRGQMDGLTRGIREAMERLLLGCCREAGVAPEEVRLICPVGNPAMQQLFLGILPQNLISIPFRPVLDRAEMRECGDLLPGFSRAKLMIVPDISAYVGADTLGCILSQGLHRTDETVLLVDIGTNGEMVLAHGGRLAACATAAGPALEGAEISCGMTACPGAIDRVWAEKGRFEYHVIAEGPARGICGSGLIAAAAAALDLDVMNFRGKLTIDALEPAPGILLTQEDIRKLQLAKGAIRAGIEILCGHFHIRPADIRQVLLAGAFGSFLDPRSACRIGLLPPELLNRIRSVGNAAGAGGKLLCTDREAFDSLPELMDRVETVDLAAHRDFAKTFALAMRFPPREEWEDIQ